MRPGALLIVSLLLAACEHKSRVQLPLQSLRVVLSSESELNKLGPSGDDLVRRPWVGPIVQLLAEETPPDNNITHMRRNRIAGSGKTPDTLFQHGLDNLRAAAPQPIQGDRTVQMAKARVQITRFADNHTASRLLLPELWSKLAADSGGQLYAAAPARDIVFWTTSAAPDDLQALRRQAQVAFQSRSYPISPAILRWTDGGWGLEDANPIP